MPARLRIWSGSHAKNAADAFMQKVPNAEEWDASLVLATPSQIAYMTSPCVQPLPAKGRFFVCVLVARVEKKRLVVKVLLLLAQGSSSRISPLYHNAVITRWLYISYVSRREMIFLSWWARASSAKIDDETLTRTWLMLSGMRAARCDGKNHRTPVCLVFSLAMSPLERLRLRAESWIGNH
jgi:hypothetical protein